MAKKFIFFILIIFLIAECAFAAKPKKSKKGKNTANDPFAEYPEEYAVLIKGPWLDAKNGKFDSAIDFLMSPEVLDYGKTEYGQSSTQRNNLKKIEKHLEAVTHDIEELKALGTDTSVFPPEEYFIVLGRTRNEIKKIAGQISSMGSTGYPSFLSKTLGGIKEERTTGITGTLDLLADAMIQQCRERTYKDWSRECKIISVSLDSKNIYTNTEYFEEAQASHGRLKEYISVLTASNSVYKYFDYKDNRAKVASISDFDKATSSMTSLLNDSLNFFNVIKNLHSSNSHILNPPANVVQSMREDSDSYSKILAIQAKEYTAAARGASTAKKHEALRTLRTETSLPVWSEFIVPYLQACNFIESDCTSKAIQMWIKTADFYAAAAEELLLSDKADLERIEHFMQGQEGIYYPGRALAEIESVKNIIEKDKGILDECKSRLNDGYIYRNNFIVHQEKLNASIQKMVDLQKEFFSIYEDAKEKIHTAQIASSEVSYYYDRSKAFSDSDDFNKSFESLQRGYSTYARQVDNLKKDGDIKNESFDKLSKLREEIIAKEQPKFVAQIRKLKNNARNEYYAGNFESASSYIFEAEYKRESWSKLIDVTLEPDEELEKIKDYVNTALAIKEGREISPYDSKAPEMRQNLSCAITFYNEGTDLIKKDRKQAEEKFSLAKIKLNQIKAYYPRNKDAGLLTLKIDKILDPVAFENAFSSKIAVCREFDYTSKSSQAQENYSNLLDLYAINPKYSGIKKIIDRAEIELGLKPKPVDQAKVAESNQLAKDAQQILNRAGRDTVLLQQAKQLAQKAILLNPQNNLAITVADEAALRSGGESAVALSSQDEELYQQAMMDLQKNNIFDANAKLKRLLSKKENERSAKIIKLKKRIEAQL